MEILIGIISLLTLVGSYNLFRLAAGTLAVTRINTVSYIFYYAIVITTFVGSIIVALGFGKDHWILCYAGNNARITAWACVCYSMLAMPLGMIFLNNLFKINTKTAFNIYTHEPIIINQSQRRLTSILICMCVFSLIMFFYIWLYSSSWPLYTAVVEKDFIGAQEGRIDVRRNFHGIIYIKNLGGLLLVPTFSYYSFIILKIKKKFKFKLFFLFLFSITILIYTYDTQKAPIVFYLIGFLILQVLIEGSIPKKNILIFIAIALLLLSVMYFFFTQGNSSVIDTLLDPRSALWGRIFVSGYAGVPLSFEWFPNVIKDPTWQIGIPEFILNIFSLPTTESARLLMLKIEPDGNLISSYFIAEAWANYGWLGVIFSPIIVGINIQAVHIFLLKSVKEPIIISFYALVTTRWVISSGFVNYLFFKSIIFPFICFLLVKILINRITIK